MLSWFAYSMVSFTPPTYNQPIQNRLGEHGVAFPVGKIVYICTNDDVHETTLIDGTFSNHTCPDGFNFKAGSGDGGYALWRRGLTYTITAGEDTALQAAGYTTV